MQKGRFKMEGIVIVQQKPGQHCNYTPAKKSMKASGIPLRNRLDKEAGVQKAG